MNQPSRKRTMKRNKKIINHILKLYGINAAGIKSKTESFNEVLSVLKPNIWMVEETKLKPNEDIKCEALNDFQVFYLSRQKSQGGGLALGVNKQLESTLINEGNDDTEVMSVLVVVGKVPIRIIVGYGVQENATKEKKDKFWDFIEKEISQAELEEQGVIIQMDGNLHAGRDLIKDDPNLQNNNGKLFIQFLERNPTLTVVNAMNICEGVITRQRQLENKTERAVLDFFLVNEKLLPFLNKMIIDEKRDYCLSNFAQAKKNKKVTETDHNGLILELAIEFANEKPERQEMFNLKNKACQDAFKNETEVNEALIKCFEDELPLEMQSKKWLKTFNSILHKCFRKVRICENKKKSENNENTLIRERIELKKTKPIDEEMKEKINERIKQIEMEIGNEIVDNYHKEIIDTIKGLGGDETCLDGSGRKRLWGLLKKKCPKVRSTVPVGKKDRKGNVITNHKGLKKLYLKTYINRLRSRPIKEEFEDLKNLKLVLFNLRKELCDKQKSQPWEMKDLEAAMKDLKKDKARDPNGWINDIFKEGVAGKDLKCSILALFNRIKAEKHFPAFIRKADISTIYKGKGEKCNLDNDRGIFIVSIFRSLIMKMMYREIYDIIDSSMSDSQIGSRKSKNIRNHIWVLNSIISDTLSTKRKKPVDIHIYDYKQCFDSLWLEECLNDMYSGGLQDDKLNLLYEANSMVDITVRTPVGKTESGKIEKVVLQGDTFGPMLCSKQVDLFGKECLEEKKYTYMYKGQVEIPPLSMVDDIVCVSECGFKSTMVNAYIQCKTNSKKLQFGASKCKKIHIGKKCEDHKCQPLYVDSWEETEENDNGNVDIKDVCLGEERMEETEEEKYLGDVISKDGRNLKNIQARVNKGKGIVQKILNILEGIPFGKLYFEVAMLLRNTLLVSSVLCNSEAWFNLTNPELNLLESIDLMFLRSLLKAPKSTSKEMFFLELGISPLRNLIRQRRLNFLHYILNQGADSMIFKVFEKQCETRTAKDWVTTVLSDLDILGLNLTFQDIQTMNKIKWKNVVKQRVAENTFEDLENMKKKHSKVHNIKHKRLEMQSYFLPGKEKVTQEDMQWIFKIRCREIHVKMNLQGLYDSFECEICKKEIETQEHVYKCKEIWKLSKYDEENISEYEEIMNGNTEKQVEVARILKEHIKIIDR